MHETNINRLFAIQQRAQQEGMDNTVMIFGDGTKAEAICDEIENSTIKGNAYNDCELWQKCYIVLHSPFATRQQKYFALYIIDRITGDLQHVRLQDYAEDDLMIYAYGDHEITWELSEQLKDMLA